jgi:ABC-type nitrate/sulfonate/bicarbonate transport system ATPase subunit
MDACNETNLMHYLSSVSITILVSLHASGLLVAHHQEVTMYICDKWYVLGARPKVHISRIKVKLTVSWPG